MKILLTQDKPGYTVCPRDVEKEDTSLELDFSTDLLSTYLEEYDLLGFEKLDANITLSPWRKSGLQVEGYITAEYIQKCVVSLKPILQNKRIDISQTFDVAAKAEPKQEIEIDIELDTPDELVDGQLDIAAFVLEHFALELDLYPRADDASIDPQYSPPTEEDEEMDKPSPFAVLKNLKDKN